ncbi:hypothetical protein ACQHIV_08610 [Kribbella sp. GL6]|uniref:hypothetical protein n=1 Tax=Kribbella sp. GL6 TaxID=3419765 RepID=UPI003CFCEE6E
MKRLAFALVTGVGLVAATQVAFIPVASASSAGPTVLAGIGSKYTGVTLWRSTPSHTPNKNYRACVSISGYKEIHGGGWNVSLRYSSSHIAFFTSRNYHGNTRSYCTPWMTQSKSSVYVRVTARHNSYIGVAKVWQYWN